MGTGAGGGSGDAWRRAHIVGNVQIKLPNGKAIGGDSGERGLVGDGEPHHGDHKGVKNEGGRNRSGPRALIGPLIEKRHCVGRRHYEQETPFAILRRGHDFWTARPRDFFWGKSHIGTRNVARL